MITAEMLKNIAILQKPVDTIVLSIQKTAFNHVLKYGVEARFPAHGISATLGVTNGGEFTHWRIDVDMVKIWAKHAKKSEGGLLQPSNPMAVEAAPTIAAQSSPQAQFGMINMREAIPLASILLFLIVIARYIYRDYSTNRDGEYYGMQAPQDFWFIPDTKNPEYQFFHPHFLIPCQFHQPDHFVKLSKKLDIDEILLFQGFLIWRRRLDKVLLILQSISFVIILGLPYLQISAFYCRKVLFPVFKNEGICLVVAFCISSQLMRMTLSSMDGVVDFLAKVRSNTSFPKNSST
jgi:hypothetical protein